METWLAILLIAIALAAGAGAGFFAGIGYRKRVAEAAVGSAEKEAEIIKENARQAAEAKKKEILLEAKEESIKVKNEAEREAKDRRGEVTRIERRVLQREEQLDKKAEQMEKKDEQLAKKLEEVELKRQEAAKIIERQAEELERVSGMTSEQAKDCLLAAVESEIRVESAKMIKEIEGQAKQEADKRARDVLATAVQRCAVDHVTETTVSVVSLPNDEMKGRIIGREGRNIRAIESLTGIDLIIDDTPEAVILSGFDPVKREIARLALEKLIVDGRVHPARIEEMVEKAKKEVETIMREAGEEACFETGVHGLHPEAVRLLGRLKYRTSYGQNVLRHSIEVSHLSGMIAGELGVDTQLAKRAGLLHDIGKSIDHEQEGSHVTLGVAFLKKHKESDLILNAVEAHHGDVEPTNIISVIVQAADAISAARPGARRETLEAYIKRLQKLEEIAESFDGVEKCFAIQAGRELRLVVLPDVVDDAGMTLLAREVAKKVETDMEYPGQIKIHLIRETRAIDYAK